MDKTRKVRAGRQADRQIGRQARRIRSLVYFGKVKVQAQDYISFFLFFSDPLNETEKG